MCKSRISIYLAIVCVLFSVATPLWAEEQKAKGQEANINIASEAKKKGLKIVKMVKPVYPPDAKAKGIEGLVKIDVVVDKEGAVKEAEATSGPEALRAAAVEAVKQWKYEPLGVEAHVTIHVNFTLAPEGNINLETKTMQNGLKIVKMVKPVYPPDAKAKGIEGLVKIDVVVDKEGAVKEAEALSGPEVLKAAALEAVRQWKYQPLGVEARATVNVNFKLGSKPPAEEPKKES